MRRKFKGGTTSLNLTVVVYDTTSTTGAGLAGLTHTTSGLILEYRRAGQSTWTQLGVATGLVSKNLGDYVSGGICASGDRVGRYEIGIPDAAIAAGVSTVEICLRGADDMHPVDIEIELDAVDYQVDAFGAIKPTVAGRTLDVSAGGEAGIDLANIGSPTTTVDLSGVTIKTATDIETDTQDIQSRLPAALVDGRIAAVAQEVADKTGYTATVSDKTGFSLLAGTGLGAQDGSVATVGLVEELAENALAANEATDSITSAVWDAPYNQHTTAGSFGRLMNIIRKANTVVEGTVTSAVTPTATSFSSNVNYPTGAFKHAVLVFEDSASINEQNSPILNYANTNGAITVEEPFTVAPTVGDKFIIVPTNHVHSIAAIVAGVLGQSTSTSAYDAGDVGYVLRQLFGMIESDGAGGWQYTADALDQVAGGGQGGTDWTANERTAIRAILGVPTSGTTPTDPSSGILDEIRDKTALLSNGGTVYVTSPVTATGQLASPLIIGDDYLAANGRRFRWTVELPSGYVIATSTARFGMRYEDDEGVNSFVATGTVTDATGGNVHLDFDVAKTVTGTLRPGWYEWSVEIVSATGVEITRVKSGKNVEWQEKQT